MKILVCIKQVPEAAFTPAMDDHSRWIRSVDDCPWVISRYDEYALEEAVLIRERCPGVTVNAISVGPSRVRSAIRKALEKGADSGYHVHDERQFIDAHETARHICAHAAAEGYDLILAGVMSEDLMQAQVGPMVAAMLEMPCVATVLREEMDLQSGTVIVTSELEGGMQEELAVQLPCLLTVQSGINRPRYPSLSNVLRARTQELHIIEAAAAGMTGPRCRPASIAWPEKRMKGVTVEGSLQEKADRLLDALHEKSLLSFIGTEPERQRE